MSINGFNTLAVLRYETLAAARPTRPDKKEKAVDMLLAGKAAELKAKLTRML